MVICFHFGGSEQRYAKSDADFHFYLKPHKHHGQRNINLGHSAVSFPDVAILLATLYDMDMFQEEISTGNLTGFPCKCWNHAHFRIPPTSESKLPWAQPENWLCTSDLQLLRIGLTPPGSPGDSKSPDCCFKCSALERYSVEANVVKGFLSDSVQVFYRMCHG